MLKKTTTTKTKAKRSYKASPKGNTTFSLRSGTGINVDETLALNCSAVWRAVSLLSGSIAQLPIAVFKESNGEKVKEPNHPVSKLLHRAPNKEMTAYQFRESAHIHLLNYGNCFAEIERLKNGTPYALHLIPPDLVTVVRDEKAEYGEPNELIYFIKGVKEPLVSDKIIHVKGPSHNGIVGMSRIRIAAESIGYSLALERFGTAFMGNAARPSAVIKNKGSMSDAAIARLKKSFEGYNGFQNTAKVVLLEEGTEFQPISINPEEAQFLESRRFSIEEIARWFNLRPQWLDATNVGGTPEHLGIDFVKWTLQPELTRYEQEFNRKLFRDSEQGYYVKHNVDALLRGELEARYRAYQIALQNGFLTVDEVRALEDKPPLSK